MNEDNTPVEDNDTDLDAFSQDFFGQSSASAEEATSEGESDEIDDIDDTSDASLEEDDTQDEDDAALATDEDEDTDEGDTDDETSEEEESKEKPKKKNRFQERINELTAKQREAERERDELLREFKALQEKLNTPEVPKTNPAPKANDSNEPDPNAKLEDGTDKYPLGEFDPHYIRDLTKYSLEQERAAYEEANKAQEQQRQQQDAKAAYRS